MIKIAFFDVDGTLLSFKTHAMPESTKRALAALRAAGVRTVISSGRADYQLAGGLRHGFDAYITMNGQLCYDEAGSYRSHPLNDADVRAVIDMAVAEGFDLLVAHADRTFSTNRGARVRGIEEKVGLHYPQEPVENAFKQPVYQFCACVGPEDEPKILEATEHVALTRWTNLFCDVVPDEGGKSYGVAATLERYGIAAEEAIAFGDGENDLSMFEAVGTAVAMGNAWDMVKERADYVTDAVDDDGIWNACAHFGLV